MAMAHDPFREPARDHPREPWPDGFREHLEAQLDGFSAIVTRALADNGASLFGDGPYARENGPGFVARIMVWLRA